MNRERTDEEILAALERWLKRVPNPEEAIFVIPSDKKHLNFAEVVKEIRNKTEFGKQWLERLKYMAGKHDLDVVSFIDNIQT